MMKTKKYMRLSCQDQHKHKTRGKRSWGSYQDRNKHKTK